MRAERHPNANLAGATGDRVGFHAVNANNREKKRDCSESAEERRAQFDDPKSDASIHKIDIRRDVENGEVGIDFAQTLTHGRSHSGNRMSILGVEANVKKDVPTVAVRERHKQSGERSVV